MRPRFTQELTVAVIGGLVTAIVLLVLSFLASHRAERYWLLAAAVLVSLAVSTHLIRIRPQSFHTRQAFMKASLRAMERENDRAAEIGVTLSRIHILRTQADRGKLLYEIERYAGHHNASIRVLYDIDPRLVPELTITTRYAAIGPTSGEGVMAFGFAYRNHASVEALYQYYRSLWELATPVLEDGVLQSAAHDQIMARHTPPAAGDAQVDRNV
jgi:hypothetical protein